MSQFDADDQIAGAGTAEKQAIILHQPARHANSFQISDAVGIIDDGQCQLEILSEAIDSDTFNNSVDLVSSSGPLAFFSVEQNSVLDFVE